MLYFSQVFVMFNTSKIKEAWYPCHDVVMQTVHKVCQFESEHMHAVDVGGVAVGRLSLPVHILCGTAPWI